MNSIERKQTECELENEYQKVEDLKKLQEVYDNLDRNLNACIDIVTTSIANKTISERLARIKEETASSQKKTNNELESRLEEKRKNINILKEKQMQSEEETEDEEKEEE